MPSLANRCATRVGTSCTATFGNLGKGAVRGGECGTRPEAGVARLEQAYRHAVSTRGLSHGEYRKWRRPHDADSAWTSRVLHWACATIAGPWCLPRDVGELTCVLLRLMMADCDVLVEAEVRLIRSAHDQDALVVLAVTDMPLGRDDARVRLVGVVAAHGSGALLSDQAARATPVDRASSLDLGVEGGTR